MTVGELIKLLQEHHEKEVVLLSVNDSLDRIKSVEVMKSDGVFKPVVINAKTYFEDY